MGIKKTTDERGREVLDLYFQVIAWLKRETGQDLVEYALLVALIAIFCIIAVSLGGQAISTVWSTIASSLKVNQGI